MFWRSVKVARLQSLSLVKKLMLLYSLSTIGLLGTICFFLYPTFMKLIEQISGTPASHLTIECFEKIIIILLLASLAAIIFGHMISRNGLKRLEEFEDKITKITAQSLDDRILLSEWPKELQSLAHRFNDMLDRIQCSFTHLSQFSSDIAHELRTPIHNLTNIAETALLHDKSHQEYKQILDSSMTEYRHLARLIENMLFIARSDHGQVVLNKTLVNAQKEIGAICEYYQAMADEKQIVIACHGNATIAVDVVLFKRIISNLLSNALRYTPSHGTIRIEIKPIQSFVQIKISDTGIGIPAAHLAKVFNRFYRADCSRSIQSGGVGLGLAIVKSIVDLHGGTINIDSTTHVGTLVSILIPAQKPRN